MYPGHHHSASVRRATLARPVPGTGPGLMMTGGRADENGLDDDDHSYANAAAMAPAPMSAVKRIAGAVAGTPVPGTPSLHRGLYKKPGHMTAATPSKTQLASATPRHANQTPASVKPYPSVAKPVPSAGAGTAPARRLLFPSGAPPPATPAGKRPSMTSTPAARHLQHPRTVAPRVPLPKPTPVRATPARGLATATPSVSLSAATSSSSAFKTPAPVVQKSARELARDLIASFHEPAPAYLGSEPVDRSEEIEYCPTRKHANDPVDPNDALFFPLDHFEIAPMPVFDFLPSPDFRPSDSASSDDDNHASMATRRHPLSPVKTPAGVLPPSGPLKAVDIVDLDFDKTAESIEANTSSSCGSDFGDDGAFVGSIGLIHEEDAGKESCVSSDGARPSRRSKKSLNQVLDEMEAARPCPMLLFESDED